MVELPNGNRISQYNNNSATFRVDNEGWICIYELFDKILIRCRRFGKIRQGVPDTHLHRAQQTDAEEFIRIRTKRVFEIQ